MRAEMAHEAGGRDVPDRAYRLARLALLIAGLALAMCAPEAPERLRGAWAGLAALLP